VFVSAGAEAVEVSGCWGKLISSEVIVVVADAQISWSFGILAAVEDQVLWELKVGAREAGMGVDDTVYFLLEGEEVARNMIAVRSAKSRVAF